MGYLVQIIMGGALLTVIVIGIVIFVKALLSETKSGVIKKFILIESLLTIGCAGTFILFGGWPKQVVVLIICSILGAFLANIPIVILVKLFQIIFRKKKYNLEQKV